MGRNCSVKNCFKNDSRNFNTSFYKFPDDVDLCGQWVQFCGSEELEAAFVAAGPYGIRGRKICSDHFSHDCFRMPERTEKGLKYGAVPRLDANEENYFDVEYLEDETVQDDSLTAACNAAMRSSTGCWTVSHISSDALTDNVRPEVYRLDFNNEQDFKIIKNSNATTSSPTNNGQPTWAESSFNEESIPKAAFGPEACNMDCDDELFSTTSPSAARRSSTGSWTVSHLSADASLTNMVRPEDEKDFGLDVSNMDCDDELLSTMSPGAAKRSSTESCTVSHLSTDASPTDSARLEGLTGHTGATFSKTTGKTKIKKSDRKLKEKLKATERTRRAAAIKRKTAENNDLKKSEFCATPHLSRSFAIFYIKTRLALKLGLKLISTTQCLMTDCAKSVSIGW
uniref:Uncharacterized protein n=1 Tax=Culex quinquefasciatus TaxID=7176 RepID=A0A1S4KID3_CULQU